MKWCRTIIVFATLYLFVAKTQANDCTYDMQEELAKLATAELTSCWTKYSLSMYFGNEVEYDIDVCIEKVEQVMAPYHSICDDGKSYASIPVHEYNVCKNLREIARLNGADLTPPGDDRDICAKHVLEQAEKRINNQKQQKFSQ